MAEMEFIKREEEILRVLKILMEERLDFIVVGGYAVSGLTRHRFSVDCDVVLQKGELAKFERILEQEGFEQHLAKGGFDKIYSGEFRSFRKRINGLPVTIDLLIDSLVCRATQASWSFEYIKRNSIMASITGISTSVLCRIPEKELLIAFKIHSGRRADIRDVVMLMEGADLNAILRHIKRGDRKALRRQVKGIIQALRDPKLVDSLKGVFSLNIDVTGLIEKTKVNMERIFEELG